MPEVTDTPVLEHAKRHINEFTWKAFTKETLSDVDGNWSSKRVITTLFSFLFVIAFFATTFWSFKVDPSVMSVLSSVILAGLAVTCAERWGKSFPDGPPGTPPMMPPR